MYFIHFRRLPTTILNFVFFWNLTPEFRLIFAPTPFLRRVSDLVQCKGSSCQRTQDVTPALLASIFPLLRWSGLNCQFYTTQIEFRPKNFTMASISLWLDNVKNTPIRGVVLQNCPTDHPTEKVFFLTFRSVHHFPQREGSKFHLLG